MTIVYGVDTTKPYGPLEARDAVVDCFTKAHSEILERDIGEFAEEMTTEESEKIKNINVQLMIKNYFKEVGGDFNSPTKESIIAVCGKLAEFARNFRAEEIIKKNYNEIMQLINGMEAGK